MLNYLWAGMLLLGIVVAAITGNISAVTTATINSSKEAIQLCITMLGIMATWTGFMKIAEKSGLIGSLVKLLSPIMKFLFPKLNPKGKAVEYISTNVIANFLGLSWAATPAGIKAMQELQILNKGSKTASKEMCMFMIFNMSSLQLVSINIIAYRAQYNSANPSEIIGPGLFATLISTVVAVVIAKFFEYTSKDV